MKVNMKRLKHGSKIKLLVDTREDKNDICYLPAGTITTIVADSCYHVNGNVLDNTGWYWVKENAEYPRMCIGSLEQVPFEVLKY